MSRTYRGFRSVEEPAPILAEDLAAAEACRELFRKTVAKECGLLETATWGDIEALIVSRHQQRSRLELPKTAELQEMELLLQQESRQLVYVHEYGLLDTVTWTDIEAMLEERRRGWTHQLQLDETADWEQIAQSLDDRRKLWARRLGLSECTPLQVLYDLMDSDSNW